MSWNGKMNIQYTNDEGKLLKFNLERTGFWKSDFCLKNEQDQVLLEFKTSTDWKKLNSGYTFILQNEDSKNDRYELLVYVGYAMNLQLALSSTPLSNF